MPLIDTLKAVASQLIVLHHLAFYGPMSDVAYPIASGSIDWLYEYGRMAVQIFLVVAGFLAARSLVPAATPTAIQPIRIIWTRYRRLAPPFLVALLTCIVCAAIARHWICHSSIPEAPTLMQLISHAFLLQGLMGQDALSAGAWYVAIDFQLFAMLTLILWIANMNGSVRTRVAVELVVCMALASLFYFNTQDSWDNWGVYFFGSYALGIISQWCTKTRHSSVWFSLLTCCVIAALLFDPRLRIAIALATSLLLGLNERYGLLAKLPESRIANLLGRISYSVFLIHFSVCMLVNTLIFRLAPNSARINLAGMVLAWILSILAGWIFYHLVEHRTWWRSASPTRQSGLVALPRTA